MGNDYYLISSGRETYASVDVGATGNARLGLYLRRAGLEECGVTFHDHEILALLEVVQEAARLVKHDA